MESYGTRYLVTFTHGRRYTLDLLQNYFYVMVLGLHFGATGWIMKFHRLVRDHELLPETSLSLAKYIIPLFILFCVLFPKTQNFVPHQYRNRYMSDFHKQLSYLDLGILFRVGKNTFKPIF